MCGFDSQVFMALNAVSGDPSALSPKAQASGLAQDLLSGYR